MLTVAFDEAGVPEQLHIERFALERGSHGAQGGTVTFATRDKSIAVDGATTLLEAGEQAGVQMPYGCRMGICQTCVVQLADGQVRDLRSGDLHTEGERIQMIDILDHKLPSLGRVWPEAEPLIPQPAEDRHAQA